MLENIKLIIWDLDETLWQGTLSDEEEIILNKENIDFIKETTDMGIVHSICSKNDYDKTKKKLRELGVWDFFVFSSIDWTPKGQRIKKIIKDMNLRNVNVLFVDDNIQNLNEAKYYCEGINVLLSSEISKYYAEAKKSEKKDKEHKRLNQYVVLEKKVSEQKKFDSNEEFLKSCNIKVDIKEDCSKHIERLHDLIMRSNQLNYTKNRQSIEKLSKLINDETIDKGYVEVKDKFGEYGIVGFYAIKNKKAIHFVFSCRTLGMLVEQYVYMKLNCPKIDIQGEVVTKLNNTTIPDWINQEYNINSAKREKTDLNILMKGPCDMEQIFSFIEKSENIDTEFSYTNKKGILIEGNNNIYQIITALNIKEKEKKEILNKYDFLDSNMLDTKLSSNKDKYNIIVLSTLPICALGIYKHKKSNYQISLLEKYYDLTNDKNTELYIKNKIYTAGIHFNENDLNNFKKDYIYIEDNNYDQAIKNLDKLYNYIDNKSKLVLILGSERKFNGKVADSYANRDKKHKELNKKIRDWAQDKQDIILLPIDKYIKSDKDFIDTINHFTKRVYYDLATDLVEIINKYSDKKINTKSRKTVVFKTILQKIQFLKINIKKKLQK